MTVQSAGAAAEQRHLRPRDGREQATTAVELLFDLVYVIAVTQLSHLVIGHGISLLSVGRAGFLLLVAWWAWIYTTWMVNWFDPTSGSVRLILVLGTLASLLMSAAIPQAFGRDSLLFALAYVGLQLGRNAGAMILLHPAHRLRRNFERITLWSLLSTPLWIAGGLVSGDRIAFWAPALALDLLAPAVGYVVPGRGRALTTDWTIEGSHFAERFQAFIIIALGESIAVTGTTVTGALRGSALLALIVAFLETGGLWWLYFGEVAEHSRRHLADAEDPGRLGRDAYSYLHLPIVAGVIMVAVANHFLIAHPGVEPSAGVTVMLVGGPAVYLAGETLFRLRMIGSVSPKRVVTVGLIAATALLSGTLSTLGLVVLIWVLLSGLALLERSQVARTSLIRFSRRNSGTERT